MDVKFLCGFCRITQIGNKSPQGDEEAGGMFPVIFPDHGDHRGKIIALGHLLNPRRQYGGEIVIAVIMDMIFAVAVLSEGKRVLGLGLIICGFQKIVKVIAGSTVGIESGEDLIELFFRYIGIFVKIHIVLKNIKDIVLNQGKLVREELQDCFSYVG